MDDGQWTSDDGQQARAMTGLCYAHPRVIPTAMIQYAPVEYRYRMLWEDGAEVMKLLGRSKV